MGHAALCGACSWIVNVGGGAMCSSPGAMDLAQIRRRPLICSSDSSIAICHSDCASLHRCGTSWFTKNLATGKSRAGRNPETDRTDAGETPHPCALGSAHV